MCFYLNTFYVVITSKEIQPVLATDQILFTAAALFFLLWDAKPRPIISLDKSLENFL